MAGLFKKNPKKKKPQKKTQGRRWWEVLHDGMGKK
jgi:hypothetical protein